MGGHEGYQQARDILSNRFGNPHLISQRIMSDLKNGKTVSTSSELQQLADELTMAVTALKSLEMFGEIDNQCGILDVLSRCPQYVRNQWRSSASQCQAFALFDTGSTNTFVSESLVKKLNLARRKTRYQMNTISDRGTTCSQMVSLHLSSVENENELCLDDVFVVRNIPARYPRQEIDMTEYPHLRGLPLVVAGQDIKADIILGMDNAHVLRPIDIRSDSTRPNSPYTTRTYFGWAGRGHP